MQERVPTLADAIAATVAYADIFQYPLTIAEIQRYLIGAVAELAAIEAVVHNPAHCHPALRLLDGYVVLAGREQIIATRQRRAAVAARMWPKALSYGRLIAALPFVRMVALTGALAVENVEEGADIDFLVITEPGRLWICRLLTIGLVRIAGLRGDIICPNYFLADTALELSHQNLYVAHELAQMLPIAGMPTYQMMRRLNRWVDRFLPNAQSAPQILPEALQDGMVRRFCEAALRLPLIERLEQWEMQRKMRKFAQQGGNPETAFSREWCKGHFDGHGRRVMDAYAERLQALAPVELERAV
ncbi:MAG: hypothetical protein Fur005_33660 [Roseiflexaceae bacterium]